MDQATLAAVDADEGTEMRDSGNDTFDSVSGLDTRGSTVVVGNRS